MSGDRRPLGQSALELRLAFDASFAEPPHASGGQFQDLLLLRLIDHPFALWTGEVSGLFRDQRVTPLPAASPELLGIALVRGGFVPVFDLRVLLGFPKRDPPRWMVLAAGRERVALAFDAFLGQFRVEPDQVVDAETAARARHSRLAVRVGDVVHPIVELGSLIDAIAAGAGAEPPKEP